MPEQPPKLKYFGTYSIRRLSKCEAAIRVPSTLTGKYDVYTQDNGMIILVPKEVSVREVDYVLFGK